MPEPVSCHAAPGSSVIQCDDITIGPEPPRPQQVEPREGPAGARALVARHTAPLVHYERTPLEPIDTPYVDIAKRCAADAIAGAVVVGGATNAHPVLGTLTAIKTGLEIGLCVADTVYDAELEANQQRAIENCVASGGTPIGIVDGILTCERAVPQVAR